VGLGCGLDCTALDYTGFLLPDPSAHSSPFAHLPEPRCPNQPQPNPKPCTPNPQPPHTTPKASRIEHYADLISAEVVHTINAALCEYHLQHCPPTAELLAACRDANAAYEATVKAVRQMDAEMACTDIYEVCFRFGFGASFRGRGEGGGRSCGCGAGGLVHLLGLCAAPLTTQLRLPANRQPHHQTECRDWAKSGECGKNPSYMHLSCKLSCRLCTPHQSTFVAGSSGLAREMAKLSSAAGAAAVAAADGEPAAAAAAAAQGSSVTEAVPPPPPPPATAHVVPLDGGVELQPGDMQQNAAAATGRFKGLGAHSDRARPRDSSSKKRLVHRWVARGGGAGRCGCNGLVVLELPHACACLPRPSLLSPSDNTGPQVPQVGRAEHAASEGLRTRGSAGC